VSEQKQGIFKGGYMRGEQRNILGWFGMEKEKEAMGNAQKQIEKVSETVTKMKEAFELFETGNIPACHEKIKEVSVAEHEADMIRREVMDHLSEGMFMPPDREDLVHLGKALDNIADWANAGARLLKVFDKKFSDEMCRKMVEFADIGVQAVSKLSEAILYMAKDVKKVLSLCTEVETLEEKGDDCTQELRGMLMKGSFDTPTLIMALELINCIEGVSDRAEDAADLVRLLIVKS